VNGDGYDDVVVGDEYFSGDQMEEGRAYIYYGSPGGLSSTPGWIADGNQSILYFGAAVAGVGDVNGDGYDDVLVGAPYKRDPTTDHVVGQALLYLGSPSGLSNTPAWTVLGTGGWTYFGGRLNGAGDLNGDSYDDFMVSDIFFTGDQQAEGRVFLYLGSLNGLAANAAWTAEGDQAQAGFGSSIGSAGDVNGDGHDEWAVGAPQYDRGESDEGIAVVFDSLATGPLPTPPPVTPSPTPTPTVLRMHIPDLDGSANPVHNEWTALVEIEVSKADGNTVDQALVSGTWSTGDTGQCTTGVYGVCIIQLSGLPKKVGSVTFTVSDVQRSQGIYEPAANNDPDGDSNGT
jgi:hypothetical protein